MKIKKTMCHPHLKVWVCNRHWFLGCSEIKTPEYYPLTKVSGLISDIKNTSNSQILRVMEDKIKMLSSILNKKLNFRLINRSHNFLIFTLINKFLINRRYE